MRRLILRALALGLVAALVSASVVSSRSAGTGTYTTWGWPRAVYARWSSWERPAGAPDAVHAGPRLQGLLEDGIFYSGIGAAALALAALARKPRKAA